MPIKTSDHDPNANTIVGKIQYKDKRARAVAILDYLAKGAVASGSGRATEILMGKLPIATITSRRSGALLTRSAFLQLLSEMQEWGWIDRKVSISGKKTYSLSLGDNPPEDWTPPTAVKAKPEQDDPIDVLIKERITELTEPEESSSYDDEARAGGIRPGRLAARLEKLEEQQRSYIPALVEEGVVAGMQGWFTTLAVAMGLPPKESDVDVGDLAMQVYEQREQIAKLTDDLRAERQSNIAAREELNIALRKQYATRDTSPVQASELPEAWRQLARHAINNGWTIGRTGGGHLLWKSPSGYRYFSSSTSSDYRAVRNARSDMEKQGLPKE